MSSPNQDLKCGYCFSIEHNIPIEVIIPSPTAQWRELQKHEEHTKKEMTS